MYTLVKKKVKQKSDTIIELLGYETRINRHTVVIYNQDLIDTIIKGKFYPDFNKVIKRIIIFIEEDGSSDNAELMLGELERLHAIYLNKYEKYLSKKEKNNYMKTLRILTNELKQLIYKKQKAKVEHKVRSK